jgi:SAM-dependent methyltransferase
MHSEDGSFWDRRYREEGAIWGEEPSPTALLAAKYLRAHDRVLDIGFGYGRDVLFLARQGCRVAGIDLSCEGRRLTEERLQRAKLQAEALITGRFESVPLARGEFDALLSHRMIHLLTTPDAIAQFATKVLDVLKPGGLLCVAARNPLDLKPNGMIRVEQGVYEYASRPGHRIRYWDDAAFRGAFGNEFEILSLTPGSEIESMQRPVPCYFTMMAARRIQP